MSEKEDLEILKNEIQKVKVQSINNMLLTLDVGIEYSGFKTIGDAILSHLMDCKKKTEKLSKEFVKKYPD